MMIKMENKGLCAYVTEELTKGVYTSKIIWRDSLVKQGCSSIPFKIAEVDYDFEESILYLDLQKFNGASTPYPLIDERIIRHFCADVGVFSIFAVDAPVLSNRTLIGKTIEVFLDGGSIKGICPKSPPIIIGENINPIKNSGLALDQAVDKQIYDTRNLN